MDRQPIISAKDVEITFSLRGKKLNAIRKCSLDLYDGETLAIVGESGSGKSVTMQTVLKLTPCELKSGQIIFDGKDITHYTDKQMQEIRGSQIGIIFQDAMTSLNPTMKIGRQITESILRHQKVNKAEAKEKALELLVQVGINNPEKRYHQYIHNLSGGMRQRVMIALALACKPKLLIADEPTTALDVTTQADIMELIRELQEKMGTSVILVTHDLGIAAEVGDRIQVMYAGEIIETGTKSEIFKKAVHPYTWALMKSVPSAQSQTEEKLYSLKGTPPDLIAPPKACAFAPRCEYCMGICRRLHPVMAAESESHSAGCWLMHPDAPKPERLGKGGTI